VCWNESQYRFRTCHWCSQFPYRTLWGGIPGKLSECLQICHFFCPWSGWWHDNWEILSTLPCTQRGLLGHHCCILQLRGIYTVFRYLESIGLPYHSSFSPSSLQCTIPSRSADQAALQQSLVKNRWFSFQRKQSRPGKPLEEFFFSFPHNSEVCHVQTLKQYEALTTPLRLKDVTKLIISLVKPHKLVKLAAITQWLHEILRLAGI